MATTEQEQKAEKEAVQVNTETFVCQNCGGIMKFDIKKQKFECAACKTEYDLQTLSDTVKENDFNLYLERERAAIPFEGMAVVACQQCGMEISFSESQFSTTCPMCGSTQVATAKQSAGIPLDDFKLNIVSKQKTAGLYRSQPSEQRRGPPARRLDAGARRSVVHDKQRQYIHGYTRPEISG